MNPMEFLETKFGKKEVDFTKTLKPEPNGMTLRKWIQQTQCLNMASLPLLNTQFAQLGAIDALESEGLMDKVTGVSGVSSGAFITALAATKDRKKASETFRKIWPGWMNMGATVDPEMSNNYKAKVLDKVLPKTFEELKIPLAIVAVKYQDDKAAATVDNKRADPVVISDGDLAESVIVSSSAMMAKGCPKCEKGFQAKNFRGMWPVADGFLKDEYGTLGLTALKPCENLLHIMPQNFPGQLGSTPNQNLDSQPKNVVSLGIDLPSSALMSMMWDGIKNGKMFQAIQKVNPFFDIPYKTIGANTDEAWEKLQYETAYQHMKEKLDQPLMIGEEANHYFLDLNLMEHWDNFRGAWEKKWDASNDKKHTEYWVKTIPRRQEMVSNRINEINEGKLSYRPGGNGFGAPKAPVALKQQAAVAPQAPVAPVK